MEDRVLEGTQRGQDETEGEEEEEAVRAISWQRVCDRSQHHTDFPPNEGGVRKCNFSVWLLTDSLRRFLLGCGVGCLLSPARYRPARISEFRCCLGNSLGEKVDSNASARGT